ncbi:MAG: hypothetical protein ACYCYR_04250 [Desulfobulbaceae bacterium]
MLVKPDLIVYFWLVPVFLFFVFPVLCFPFIFLGKKSRVPVALKAAEGAMAPSRRLAKAEEMRVHPRRKIDGLIAQISDGVHCCKGSIADISQAGVRLVSPDGRLDRNTDSMGVLLTGGGESFHMRIKPRWQENRAEGLSIGATIEETLGSWKVLSAKAETGQFAKFM